MFSLHFSLSLALLHSTLYLDTVDITFYILHLNPDTVQPSLCAFSKYICFITRSYEHSPVFQRHNTSVTVYILLITHTLNYALHTFYNNFFFKTMTRY